MHSTGDVARAPSSLSGARRPEALAGEFGTREEAIAMVKRVQAKIANDGLEVTLRAINSASKQFVDRDLYPFVLDFNGNDLANAKTPSVVGRNIIDLKDQDGKFFVQ